MKEFELPEMEIIRFNVADIITNSLPFTPFSALAENELDIVDISKP